MITTTYIQQNPEIIEKLDNIIRKYSFASNGYYLLRIEKAIKWDEMADFIFKNFNEINKKKFEKQALQSLIKSLIFGKIFKYPDHQIPSEIAKNKAFITFIGAEEETEIPKIIMVSSFHQVLVENGLYDYLLEKFYSQLNSEEPDLLENSELFDRNKLMKDGQENNNTDDNINFDLNDKLYIKMFDLFFDSLDVPKSDEILSEKELKTHQLMEKLKYVDEIIKELKKKLNGNKENQNNDSQSEEEIKQDKRVEEPIELRPKIKTEGIFNDENLTEDYEIGYRFHQLGLKMGFFNVKLDNNNESSRISTAEFFPNKFWPSVKQRSRWIAGICLQNWKAHKWKGNLTMKYFLFRDRKPLFSLFGAFFSNLILFYLIYAIAVNLIFGGDEVYLVSHSSVLYYLMAANVIFMVSRASHRFIFTYNWYGFKYAFFSFFRLIIDTAVNFFAVLRALSVFRKTKKKVVWDATTHY